jgi:hypothetical protein
VTYRPIASGQARRFDITLGLREGYGPFARVHDLAAVATAHQDWQRQAGQVLGVVITRGLTSYGWPEGDTIRGDSEPSVTVAGVVNVLYQDERTDMDVLADVMGLARFLGERFNQERVYLMYRDAALILEREKEQP